MKKTFLKLTLAICFTALSHTLFAQNNTTYDINFNPKSYKEQSLTLNGKTIKVRAYENIIYVQNPVDTAYQKMNIYVPEEYFAGKSINGYSVSTAPIFFPNQIGGYMPGRPASTANRSMGMMAPPNGELPKDMPKEMREHMPPGGPAGFGGPKTNTVLEALAHGYVVASAGARGRTMKTGKAPAAIVDLKAAVRYLKFNDKNMPGDANKIVSNGTSAGGAMSSLLGATGNNADYEPYLKALGAAPATDDIFAVSAYCPITNLDKADMAYEWQFNGFNTYKKGEPMAGPNATAQTLNAEQQQVSKDLAAAFPAYVNTLNLKDEKGNSLTLDQNGNGTFKNLVKSYVIASANIAITKGAELSAHKWLSFSNGKVTDIDWPGYITYMERQKTPPAFDALDFSSPETQEFGTETVDKQHFTSYGQEHSKVAGSTMADSQMIKMMNPFYYVGAEKTNIPQHWRIRHGSKDKDGSLATPVLLATLLQNKGYDVNLELPWDKPHSGDYDLPELFRWIDKVCK